MTTTIFPEVGSPVVLVSHGTTVTFQAAHAADEYAVTSTPYGNRSTGWSADKVREKIADLLEKGYEVQK